MIRKLTSTGANGSSDDFLPDLTAMLDILFILLVFFILTAGTAFHTLDLSLPATPSSTLPVASTAKTVLLEVQNDQYLLSKKPIDSLEALKGALPDALAADASGVGNRLVVAGDKAITIERFLEVLTFLRVNGIEAADILMTPQTSRP